jgi:hypothetical protein
VVRYGQKDDATHRLTRPAAEGRRLDGGLAQREEVIRGGTDQLGLAGGQARAAKAQPYHLACGRVAFCGLERERQAPPRSIDKLKRPRRCQGRSLALPALERIRGAA